MKQAKLDAALEKVLGGDFDDDGDVLKDSEIDNNDKNVNEQEKNNLSSTTTTIHLFVLEHYKLKKNISKHTINNYD